MNTFSTIDPQGEILTIDYYGAELLTYLVVYDCNPYNPEIVGPMVSKICLDFFDTYSISSDYAIEVISWKTL